MVFLAATTALLAFIGVKRRWSFVQGVATYLPAVAAVIALLYSMGEFQHPSQSWGAFGWIGLFAAHWLWLRRRRGEEVAAIDWLHAGAIWMLTLLVAWEAHWQIV